MGQSATLALSQAHSQMKVPTKPGTQASLQLLFLAAASASGLKSPVVLGV